MNPPLPPATPGGAAAKPPPDELAAPAPRRDSAEGADEPVAPQSKPEDVPLDDDADDEFAAGCTLLNAEGVAVAACRFAA